MNIAEHIAARAVLDSTESEMIYEVAAGSGEQEIMAAQDWIKARAEFGVLKLSSKLNYTITDTVVLDSQRISIEGNNAKWVASGFLTEKPILRLDNTLSIADSFVGMRKISNLHIHGGIPDVGDSRDNFATGIYSHSATTSASIRVLLDTVTVQGCGKGIALGSRTYFLRGIGVEVFRCKFGLIQEAGASDFAENVTFIGGTIFNSDCLLKDLGGQRFKFYGTSFDFFGDPTGNRVTSDDMLLDLRAGSEVEMFGCHLEFNYGGTAGQTNAPITLVGANTKFSMFGGKIYNGGTQNPLWPHLIKTESSAQVVNLDNVQLRHIGRTGNATHDDSLVGGTSTDNNGVSAQVNARHLRVVGVDKNDLPAVLGYTWGSQFLRNGVDDPHTELVSRITVTGTAAISKVTGTENGVTPRNGIGSMLKITGAGKVIISLPVYEVKRRHAWSMFLNALVAVGTITVRERHSTVNQKWDGSTGLTVAADTRNSYTNTTVTLTTGANAWNRTSWKDVVTDTVLVPRMNCSVFAIEIDTTLMSSGSLYLDDVGFALM